MDIEIVWSSTIELVDDAYTNMIFLLPQKCQIPSQPGIYILGRKYGNSISVIYIGKADNLKGRIDQQLNNVKLMMALKNSGKGRKILMFGKVKTKPGQKRGKILSLLESNYIEYAKLSGNELVNILGVKNPYHEIINLGNLDIRRVLSFKMKIKAQ